MAMTPEEQAEFDRIKSENAKKDSALAEARSAVETLTKSKTELESVVKQNAQEAVTNRVKAEYPDLVSAIGDLIPVGNYDVMKAAADKLKALKAGSPPQSQSFTKPDGTVVTAPAGLATDQLEQWKKAQGISPAIDPLKQEKDQKDFAAYQQAHKAGDVGTVIRTLLSRHAPKLEKMFTVKR
jgi:hypothetical protein